VIYYYSLRDCYVFWIAISSTGDIKHIHVVLKVLNVKNIMVHTEWRTTDPLLDVIKPIPSLTLLERPL